MTKGVEEAVPFNLQLVMWGMVDKQVLKGLEMDYLQVFELEAVQDAGGKVVQRITQTQEVPERENVREIPSKEVVSMKLYVIDSTTYTTMLLPEEY
jgi:hypothetical protein